MSPATGRWPRSEPAEAPFAYQRLAPRAVASARGSPNHLASTARSCVTCRVMPAMIAGLARICALVAGREPVPITPAVAHARRRSSVRGDHEALRGGERDWRAVRE